MKWMKLRDWANATHRFAPWFFTIKQHKRTDMQEDTKISDLTVAEFRQLMQQCFDRDRAMEWQREMARMQSTATRGPGPRNNPAEGGGSGYTNGGTFCHFW